MNHTKIKFFLPQNIVGISIIFLALFLFTQQGIGAQRNFFSENVAYPIDNPPIKDEVYTFKDLGKRSTIKLQGNLSQASIGFGSRIDEIVTAAKIDVTYIYSPALTPDISHVRVLINHQLAGIFPIEAEKSGKPITKTINFDARDISKFNEISFELIAYRDIRCSNQALMSQWFEINPSSQLSLSTQPLPLKNDLGIFPKPFFDENDFTNTEIPFIFAENAQNDTIEAAGIAATYFGSKSKWRKAHFPILINQLPTKHALVFATNNNRPEFLKDIPEVDGPSIQLINHPENPFVKLLLILGRDKQDLRNATEGLSTGSAALVGSYSKITQINQITPRKPYDAPYWVPLDKEVKFGELIEHPEELQTEGRNPNSIILNFNITPDLFVWHTRGIPLNMKYRYSPPNEEDDSQLSVFVNDIFIKGLNLNASGLGNGDEPNRLRVPLVDKWLFGEKNTVLIPGFRLGSKNTLKFNYTFTKPEGGDCQELNPTYMHGSIDADSTIDLSDFSHYLAMPDLRSFATLGFPFTRLADLADTAIIVNENASKAELESYLEILSNFGASTGLTATKFSVYNTTPFKGIENKDILLISVLDKAITQENDNAKLAHSIISGIKKTISLPVHNSDNQKFLQPKEVELNSKAFTNVSMENEGDIGVVVGFQSPWKNNKSVVAVMATDPSSFKKITNEMVSQEPNIRGSSSFFRSNDIVNLQVGDIYYVGYLPVLKLLWFELSDSPFLVSFLILLMVILMIFVLTRLLKFIAYARLHHNDD